MNGVPFNKVSVERVKIIRPILEFMKNKSLRSSIACFSSLICAFAISAQAAMPGKLLVVTVTKGFRHSSIPTAEKVLGELGQKSGAFTVDYVRNDQEMAEKMTLAALRQYDGVIFANTTGDLPLPDRQGFIDWVKSGKAFVAMHSGSDTFHGFPPYIEMLGGEFQTHHAQVAVECINQDTKHPATRHLDATFRVFDEIYIQKNFHREQVHGLLALNAHPNDKTPGDYPIAWCKMFGKGRVFYASLGHREDVWDPDWTDKNGKRENSREVSQAYQKHILGGIQWALGLEKGDATPQTK